MQTPTSLDRPTVLVAPTRTALAAHLRLAPNATVISPDPAAGSADRRAWWPLLDVCADQSIAATAAEVGNTADLVTDALVMAIWRRGKPDELLHHSDQGSQYTSEQFQRLMADHGITCSMSQSGNVWDNAAMESFFGTLKSEFFYLNKFVDIAALKSGLRRYIRYYNHQRIRLKLNGLSPVQYRLRAVNA